MAKKTIKTEGFKDTIQGLENIINEILFCFDEIGNYNEPKESEETPYLRNNTKLYFNLVGNYTAYLNRLLDVYHDNPREKQLEYKAEIIYFRKAHEFLVFILRYPAILKVKAHDEIVQTRLFLENKPELIKKVYKLKAAHENALFAGDFRKNLDKILGNRVDRKINEIKDKKSSNLIE